MLSFSYRAFLIMDQLRRRANISVAQLHCISQIEQTNYSRISARVYTGLPGVLHAEAENGVVHALRILGTGYITNVISPTTMPPHKDIEAVLVQLESEVIADQAEILADCDLSTLLSAANNVLNVKLPINHPSN